MLLSPDAAARVERVDEDYLRVRVGALSRLPGNPYGAEVRVVGGGCGFLVEAVPNPLFNHVVNLDAGALAELPELAAWYARHGKPLRVDVTPAQSDRQLLAALVAQGLSQTGFYAGLYAELAPADCPELDPASGCTASIDRPESTRTGSAIDVAPVDPEEFAEVYVAGFGFPERHRAAMAESMRVLADHPSVDFFRARVGRATAGVGLLFRADTVGYLATAATLPQYRRRGVQSALVRYRMLAARQAGCDLVVGHTTFGGASHRAMERSGLRVAYTKALWGTAT
ncbi:GNAT family N-acetyltransferase [Rugosimonospora acidiphila]|uniref:GNAT family N-acetyltransferase n=1 Tax=Rugosimonospora acidiphila TaxID=556531 RepID=A0ABP9RM80_9ACTN